MSVAISCPVSLQEFSKRISLLGNPLFAPASAAGDSIPASPSAITSDNKQNKAYQRARSRAQLIDHSSSTLLELMACAWAPGLCVTDAYSGAEAGGGQGNDSVLVWAGLRIRCGVASGIDSAASLG